MEHSNQQHNLERFRQIVLAEHTLHERLRATPNEAAFLELAVRLAAEHGCELSPATLRTAIREQRRIWLERWL